MAQIDIRFLQEVDKKIGNLNSLSTTDKGNVVAAINEVLAKLNERLVGLEITTPEDFSNMLDDVFDVNP